MSKRELIDTGPDKHYLRRDDEGRFKESVDVSRSLSADRGHKAKTDAKQGEGDRRPSANFQSINGRRVLKKLTATLVRMPARRRPKGTKHWIRLCDPS
jgi:hypothetical protein